MNTYTVLLFLDIFSLSSIIHSNRYKMNSNHSEQGEPPEILLQLRQKAVQLRENYAELKEDNKVLGNTYGELSDRFNVLMREKEVQERKSRSLVLLVTDIQRQLDDTFMEVDVKEEPEKAEG